MASQLAETLPAPISYAGLVSDVRACFDSGKTRPIAWRIEQLEALRRFTVEQERAIFGALRADLGKGEAEALTTEVAFVRAEIDHMLSHLASWMAPSRKRTPMLVQPGKSYVVRDPLGVVLVIGAWNLPIPVLLGPVAAAIAAGNAVVMKPSELAPATSDLIARHIGTYLDREAIAVVEGGVDETTALLREKFDHIFYTGNGTVGRIIALEAAESLTPVTLELGGKNPAIVDRTADLKVAARRLAWAKWMNAGQVCVSPDYVLVERSVASAFVDEVQAALKEFYGSDPAQSRDYGRIVNPRHFDRLMALLSGHGGRVATGGRGVREDLYIEPAIVIDPKLSSPLMQDEIFGPIMPVIGYDSLDEAFAIIGSQTRPLVIHAFTSDSQTADRIERETLSGAFMVNDAIVNHRVPDLPFGGVGASGMGAYHGRAGFETFSHRKAVLRRPTMFDLAVRYPPYTPSRLRWLRRLTGA